MFADKLHYSNLIHNKQIEINEINSKIDTLNTKILDLNKSISETFNEFDKENKRLQNAIDRIEKIEIISKEEIKRVLDEIMKLNEENNIEIPNEARELSNRLDVNRNYYNKLGEQPNLVTVGGSN